MLLSPEEPLTVAVDPPLKLQPSSHFTLIMIVKVSPKEKLSNRLLNIVYSIFVTVTPGVVQTGVQTVQDLGQQSQLNIAPTADGKGVYRLFCRIGEAQLGLTHDQDHAFRVGDKGEPVLSQLDRARRAVEQLGVQLLLERFI